MKFSIFGANGFLGKALVRYFRLQGHNVLEFDRNFEEAKLLNLGNVIFAAGVTSDFKQRPHDTMKCHVDVTSQLLQYYKFDSFLYLSSTRLYNNHKAGYETAEVNVKSHDLSDLYNISKLAGEAICFSHPSRDVKIARLSNIVCNRFASNNFVDKLINDSFETGKIEFSSGPNTEKDYLTLEDALYLIERIVQGGEHRIYNVASGENISHQTLLRLIKNKIAVEGHFPSIVNDEPRFLINISRIKEEFGFIPTDVAGYIKRGIDDQISQRNNN